MTLWEWFGIAVFAVVLGSYLLMLVTIFADSRDHDLGGLGGAAWVVGLILFPVLGALFYLSREGTA